jgi:autotransporter translocation and assembly factor TamB
MPRKIFIFLMAAVVAVFVSLFFAWRLNFLELPVRAGVQKLTGLDVSFKKIDYRPFNRITVDSLTIGRNFRCDRVTVYFNPLKLALNLRKPELSLVSVSIDKPWIALNDELLKVISSSAKNSGGKAPRNVDISISWQDGEVTGPYLQLSGFKGDIALSEGIKGSVSAKTPWRGGAFTGDFNLKRLKDFMSGELNAAFESADAGVALKAKIDRLAQNDIKVSFTLPVLKYKACDLKDSSGGFTLSRSGVNGELKTPAGNARISGENLNNFAYEAGIDLAKIDRSLSGGIFAGGKSDYGVLDGSVSARGVSVSGNLLGSAFFAFRKEADGALAGKGSLQPNNILFDVSVDKEKKLLARFKLDRKETGRIHGSLAPLNLKINFNGFPAARLPVPIAPRLRGFAGLTGSFTKTAQDLTLYARDWTVDGGEPSAWTLSVTGNEFQEWTYDGGSEEKDWRVSGKWKGPGDWYVASKLRRFDLGKLSVWLPAENAVKGSVTGEASYSGNSRSGGVNVMFDSLAFDGIFDGSGKLSCAFSPETLEIKDFALHSKKGTVSGQAKIGRTEQNNDLRVNLVFYNFPFNDVLANGSLKLSGETAFGPKWSFTGNLSGNDFKVYKFPQRRLRASITASADQLEIRNLQWEKLFSGNLIIGLKTKVLYGKIRAKNIQIGDFVDNLTGGADAEVSILGTTDNPVIKARCSVPEAKFRNAAGGAAGEVPFSLAGTVIYSGKTLSCENIKLESGGESLTLAGKVYPSLDARGEITGISSEFIKKHAELPFDLEGKFTGSYSLSGEYKDPLVDAVFSGQNLSLGKYPLGALSGRAVFQGGTLKISNLLVKFSDSEFRISEEGTLNLKKSTFSVKSNLRNVHAGPVDIFGNLNLSGSWAKQETGGPAFSFSAEADNLRLNDYVIESAKLNIKYKDKIISFLPQDKQDLQLSGYVDLTTSPDIKFQRLLISADAGKSTLLLDGQIGEKGWDFAVSGKAVSASAVSEILGSPVECEGSGDLNLIGSGNLEQPRLEGSFNISGGSVSGIPFDNINLQFNARQDVLTVMRARIVQKDQYTIIANGFAPFFLTSEVKKRVERNPINLTLSIEEGTLNLLTGFSKDIKSAKGIIHSQLNITGTMASPVTNGYLRITDGEIDSKAYFSRLSKLNIYAVWKNNLLTINEFSGIVGEGLMKLDGFVRFDGLKAEEYGLNWRTEGKKGISISIPQLPIPSAVLKPDSILTDLSRGDPKFDIKLTGKAENPLLSGWVELENTNFTYPSVLKKTGEESSLDSFWPKLSWDLELRTGKSTWFENELVHISAKGFIKLTGKGSQPTADGKLEALSGDLSYLGAKMSIIQAVFEVVKDDCYLAGKAEAKAYGVSATGTSPEEDTITMTLDRAKIGAINPRFTSLNNPGLSSQKALARLTGVDTDAYTSADKDMLLRRGIVQLFSSSFATPFAKSLMKKAGIDLGSEVMPLEDPAKAYTTAGNATIPELLQGTKVTAQRNITPNLRVGYSMLFDQIQNALDAQDKLNLIHSFEFQYQFENSLFLKGQYDFQNVNSMYEPDRRVTIEKRWRFGWTKDKNENVAK